ncbi:hypothetical protein QLH32_05490 [Acinetobacter corruptisaponis]|uniref:Uncharacterized protein n=1 Tax=Acinetobacter corruptisaponis TaxID=3045147 RepID=A0ABY8S5E2_9GAMM|nr:hypothetical protein [Acinetobacter sp. KCTC 92772]WHP06920.1 hypothetical protein QLH32_05490 [Acinetobacter sp. KCTC 92772]
MKLYYLKKDNLYLHVQTTLFEQYEDSSAISGLFSPQYIFSEKKDGAMQFSNKADANRYLILNSRKLKDFTVAIE